jgi:hypothetical protein
MAPNKLGLLRFAWVGKTDWTFSHFQSVRYRPLALRSTSR